MQKNEKKKQKKIWPILRRTNVYFYNSVEDLYQKRITFRGTKRMASARRDSQGSDGSEGAATSTTKTSSEKQPPPDEEHEENEVESRRIAEKPINDVVPKRNRMAKASLLRRNSRRSSKSVPENARRENPHEEQLERQTSASSLNPTRFDVVSGRRMKAFDETDDQVFNVDVYGKLISLQNQNSNLQKTQKELDQEIIRLKKIIEQGYCPFYH